MGEGAPTAYYTACLLTQAICMRELSSQLTEVVLLTHIRSIRPTSEVLAVEFRLAHSAAGRRGTRHSAVLRSGHERGTLHLLNHRMI